MQAPLTGTDTPALPPPSSRGCTATSGRGLALAASVETGLFLSRFGGNGNRLLLSFVGHQLDEHVGQDDPLYALYVV